MAGGELGHGHALLADDGLALLQEKQAIAGIAGADECLPGRDGAVHQMGAQLGRIGRLDLAPEIKSWCGLCHAGIMPGAGTKCHLI